MRIARLLLTIFTFALMNQQKVNAEEWQFMFDNNLQIVSYAKSSVVKSHDDVIYAWVKYDYAHAYWVHFSEIHFLFEIDCRKRKMRTVSSKRFAKDNRRLEDGGATEWQFPRGDGPTESIYLFFCKDAAAGESN